MTCTLVCYGFACVHVGLEYQEIMHHLTCLCRRWSPISSSIPSKPRPSHSSTTPTVSTSQTTSTSITNTTTAISSQSVGKRGGRQGAGKKKAVLQFPQLSNNSINERGEQSITDGSCAESKGECVCGIFVVLLQ